MSKIPSSLKWLVRRRARVKGLIEASERELLRLTKIEQRLSALKADLAAPRDPHQWINHPHHMAQVAFEL